MGGILVKFASDLDPGDDSSNDQTVTLTSPSQFAGVAPNVSEARVRLYTPVASFDNLPDRLEGIFVYVDIYASPVDGLTILFHRAQKLYNLIMKDEVGDEFSAVATTVISVNVE
jgi:hypothetical protein